VVTPAELLMNPVPETNSVKVWLPAVMLAGARFVMIGVALGCTCEEEPPQPAIRLASRTNIPNVVHRRCINRILQGVACESALIFVDRVFTRDPLRGALNHSMRRDLR